MKKTKQPGDNISLKTKKTEDPWVMDWINAQTNLMDSLRYLIEHEIRQNGVRNLQAFIPAERNVLGDVVHIPERKLEAPRTETNSSAAADLEGLREIVSGIETVSAARTEDRNEPEPQRLSEPRKEMNPQEGLASLIELKNTDDEIAEEDIEAWV